MQSLYCTKSLNDFLLFCTTATMNSADHNWCYGAFSFATIKIGQHRCRASRELCVGRRQRLKSKNIHGGHEAGKRPPYCRGALEDNIYQGGSHRNEEALKDRSDELRPE